MQQDYYVGRAQTDYGRWIEEYMRPVAGQVEALMRCVRGTSGSPSGDLSGSVLELACGTGWFTKILSGLATDVTAVDGSAEMLEIVEGQRMPNVRTFQADLFRWQPSRRWDAAFMANWLAHVPVPEFEGFWRRIERAVEPGGVVVCVDVTIEEQSIEGTVWEEGDVPVVGRPLNGVVHPIIKYYWDPGQLLEVLRGLGWRGVAIPVGRDKGRGFVYYRLERAVT